MNEKETQIKRFEITKNSCGEFALNTNINNYNLSQYNVSDTSAYLSEDNDELTKGKILNFEKNESLCLWLYNDTISEILIRTSQFMTKDNIRVGLGFNELFNKIEKLDIQIDNEWGLTIYIKDMNMVLSISNSGEDDLTIDEVNSIYAKKPNINKEKLEKMKVNSIRILNYVD